MDHDDEPMKEDQFRQQIEQEKQLIVKKKTNGFSHWFFSFCFLLDSTTENHVEYRTGMDQKRENDC